MPFLLKPRKNPALTAATLMQNRHLQVSLHNIMSRFIEALIYLSYSHVKILQTWCHILKTKSKTYQGEMLSASRLTLQKENKEGWKNNICLLLGLWSSHANVWSSVNHSTCPWSLNPAFLSAAKVTDGPICGEKLLPCDVPALSTPTPWASHRTASFEPQGGHLTALPWAASCQNIIGFPGNGSCLVASQ